MKMNKETWNELVKPVVVLTVICLVSSAILAYVNSLTAPVIEANKEAAANAVYASVLPEAEGKFEDMTDKTTVAGVVAIKKAENGAGWCIQATGKGFGGDVPVILALDNEGVITGASFMPNQESPGFGQKLCEADGEEFAKTLVGKSGSVTLKQDGVDGISGATISSTAAVSAINTALNAFGEVALGAAPVEEPKFDAEAFINEALPEAEGQFTDVDENTKAAANGAGYAITAFGTGFNAEVPVPALVVIDNTGVIRKVAFLENGETAGLGASLWDGSEAGQNLAAALAGKSGSVTLNADGVDQLAGATMSSQAAVDAVNSALAHFAELNAKEAA